MKIKEISRVEAKYLPEYVGVQLQQLLDRDDGSNEITMRLFTIAPGGSSPYHQHDFPHLVKIEKGRGLVVDADKNEHPLSEGMVVYIDNNEKHCLKNTGDAPFQFICIIPDMG